LRVGVICMTRVCVVRSGQYGAEMPEQVEGGFLSGQILRAF